MLNSLFGRFGGGKKEPGKIDLSLGFDRTEAFKRYLHAGKYSLFEQEYEKLNWDAKTLLNEGIGLEPDNASAILKWVRLLPDSYIACLFAGVSKTAQAWIARSSSVASEVANDQFRKFTDLLNEAVRYLVHADQLNPEDAEICARMIRVYMGLGVEEEKVVSYFEAAASFVPNHLMAHLMMINYLNPKWGGSVDRMYAFADERYEKGGSSLLIVLKLFCLVEEWLYYGLTDEPKMQKAFFQNEDMQQYILSLYAAYREEEDGALLIPYVYNYFGFLFYKIGEKEKAKTVIKKIDGKMTIYPWAYMDVNSNAALQKLIV